MAVAKKIMPASLFSRSSTLVDVSSEASGEESDPIANKIMPASQLSRSSTLVDVVPKASGEESDPVAKKIRSATLPPHSSTSVDVVVGKVSGVSLGKWDPTIQWAERKDIYEYRLAAEPQQGYPFPEYLGHADPGPYRLGAVFSRPHDMDSIIFAPKAMPDEHAVAISGRTLVYDKNTRSDSFFDSFLSPSRSDKTDTKRKFFFQRLEQHWVKVEEHLTRMVDHESVLEHIGTHRLGHVYVITGLRIADGLQVWDGKFYRKFDGRVILSYRMNRVNIFHRSGQPGKRKSLPGSPRFTII